MALGQALMGIDPFPMLKNSSLSTIGSNSFGCYLYILTKTTLLRK